MPLILQMILGILSARFPQPERRHNTARPVLGEPSAKRILQAQGIIVLISNYPHLLADHPGISASSSGG